VTELVLAALFLPLSHFGISSSSLRARLVDALGERAYQGLYSLVTLGAFAWLVIAYRHAPTMLLWVAPAFVNVAALLVVLLAFLLVVVGVTTPNPTTVGAEALFERADSVRGVVRITRNPFLWGTGLWALAHIAATGDAAALLLFGSIGSLGLLGASLLDAKKARQHGERWRRFAAQTSSAPFVAIAQGRQRLALGEIGLWRVAVALTLFAVFASLHSKLFGVSPFPS
jgi:uncharacterized membrane protein